MNSHKIIVLTHEYAPFPGGEANYASGIVAGFRSLGRDVVVIAPDYRLIVALPVLKLLAWFSRGTGPEVVS